MATIITLFCLVHGDLVEHVFKIRIDKDSDVADLKNEIKEKMSPKFDDIPANELTLWKVDISYDDEDAVKQLALKETDVIKKMLPASEIGEYFENTPTKKRIHVVIECPAAGGAHAEGKY
jgi:Crinkler effector protein N-terminal domain